jgi:PAS domain-containing protein
MILIRRYLLALLLVSTCVFVLLLGARGYMVLRNAGGVAPEELRLRGENLLFLSIILAAAAALFLTGVVLRSRNITRELDKIVDIARYGSTGFDESLRRLGPVGERIRRLNERLADLSEKKTLRISAMAAINAFLLNNIRLPVLITDITGKITAVSPRAAEKIGEERSAVVGRYIKEVVPEVDFQAVASRLEKEHVEVGGSREKETMTYYPVLNRSNELSNVICVIGKEEVVAAVAAKTEERPGRARSVSRVARFVRKAIRGRV